MKAEPAPELVGIRPDADEANLTLRNPRMPVEARGLALGILATIATIYALAWAQTLLVPLLLGVVITYTLSPVVFWLERISIPRVAGTVVVMASVVAALGLSGYSLRGQLPAIVEQLPNAATKISVSLARLRTSQRGNLQKIESAAADMENATISGSSGAGQKRQPAPRVAEPPKFRLNDFLWEGSIGAIGVAGQAGMVLFLVFFLLLGGDTFKRKLVRLAGPTLSQHVEPLHPLAELLGE